MSKLQVDILESKSGIGLTCTPAELFYQRAFAWAAIDYPVTNTYSIDQSFNISAVTFEQTGRILFTFENAAANDKYIVVGMSGPGNNDTNTNLILTIQPDLRPNGSSGITTTHFAVRNNTLDLTSGQAATDRDYTAVAVFGGF